jgi:hypothetical protein
MDLLQQVAFEAEHCWTSNVQSFLSERHIVMNIPIAMPKERGEWQKLQSIPVYEVVGRLAGALSYTMRSQKADVAAAHCGESTHCPARSGFFFYSKLVPLTRN